MRTSSHSSMQGLYVWAPALCTRLLTTPFLWSNLQHITINTTCLQSLGFKHNTQTALHSTSQKERPGKKQKQA